MQHQKWNQGDVRVDHQASPKDNFFARWSIQNTETRVPSTFPPVIHSRIVPTCRPGRRRLLRRHFVPAGAARRLQLRPRHQPQARERIPRRLQPLPGGLYGRPVRPGAGLGNKLGIANSNVTPNEQNLPIFSPSNYFGIGQTRSLPIFRRENTFQYIDNMSATFGKHTLKWGVDFRRRQLTIYQTNQGNGRFNFSPAFTDSRQPAGSGGDTMASFLLGYPSVNGSRLHLQLARRARHRNRDVLRGRLASHAANSR